MNENVKTTIDGNARTKRCVSVRYSLSTEAFFAHVRKTHVSRWRCSCIDPQRANTVHSAKRLSHMRRAWIWRIAWTALCERHSAPCECDEIYNGHAAQRSCLSFIKQGNDWKLKKLIRLQHTWSLWCVQFGIDCNCLLKWNKTQISINVRLFRYIDHRCKCHQKNKFLKKHSQIHLSRCLSAGHEDSINLRPHKFILWSLTWQITSFDRSLDGLLRRFQECHFSFC